MAISARLRARKRYRTLRRGLPEEESVSHLNITPMMDMMTILLIFFLKNFAVSVENVSMSDEMTLPRSTTQLKAKKAVQVTVTKRAILVESGDREDVVAAVKRGEVDASLKRDGQSGYLINPLLKVLQKHATRLKMIEKRFGKRYEFKGEMTLVADQTTPYRLISEVLYTAGQAEYGRYRLMVLRNE